MTRDRWVVWAATITFAGSLAALAVMWPSHRSGAPGADDTVVSPRATRRLQSGTEVVVILAAASHCPYSTDAAFPTIVGEAITALRRQTTLVGKNFVYVGISLDQEPSVGLALMERFGPFDELIVGGGWLNTGSIAFMIRESKGTMAVPHLAIIERDINVRPTTLQVSSDRVLARYVGATEIRQLRDELLAPAPAATP